MIKLVKTVDTYTKESFSRKCKNGMLLEKNYDKGKLIPAQTQTHTTSKVVAGVYLGNYEVQTYGLTTMLVERKFK